MEKLVLIIISLILIQNIIILGQNKRVFTAEDLWKIKRLSSLKISPDGKYGCFVVTEYDLNNNKGNSDLYLIKLNTYEIRRLTTNLNSDHSPV